MQHDSAYADPCLAGPSNEVLAGTLLWHVGHLVFTSALCTGQLRLQLNNI